MLIDKRLPLALPRAVDLAIAAFPPGKLAPVKAELEGFLFDRLRGLLREQGFSANEVEAVVSLAPARIDSVPDQLNAVRAFTRLPEADSLAAANKRIGNILKKAEGASATFDRSLLLEPAEKDLAALLTLILRESGELTGSDSGTIYVREDDVEFLENATAKDTLSRSTPYLVAKFTRTDSLDLPFKEFRLPFDVETVAGFVG